MKVTRVKCLLPFTDLIVNAGGYCYSCSSVWTTIGNVGKLTARNSLMEIWNNERMQYLRKTLLEDRLNEICNFKYCPHAIKDEYLQLETLKNEDPNFNRIIGQIMAGRTILDTPPYRLSVNISGKCNLRCVMCRSNDEYIRDDERLLEKLYLQIIPEMLPGISKLFLAGNGEVFFNPYSRKFLQSLDSNQYPQLKIQILTNGTLFTPKLWETIKKHHYDFISVSVDAATPQTYEKIRKNGKWDQLQRNLEFISELKRQKVIPGFSLNFCVMKSNYREMKDFVEFGLRLGAGRITFQRIYSVVDIRENINLVHHQKIWAEIGQILRDPIFSRLEVDTTEINDYRDYADINVSVWGKWLLKVKERALYFPIKGFFAALKYFPYTIEVYEFFHWKKVSLPKTGLGSGPSREQTVEE